MNIVKMAMGVIGPAIASRIASKLGINNALVNRAIAMALPAILAAFTSKANSSGGAGALFDMIRGQDRGQLDNLDSILGGADAGRFAQSGKDMLGGLLGGDGLGALTGALGRQSGLDRQQSESIFGLLGPVAAGSLGKVAAERDLDSHGLLGFLDQQKDNIAEALPREMAQELSGTGLLGAFDTTDLGRFGAGALGAGAAGAAATGAAGRAYDTARDAVSDRPSAAPSAARPAEKKGMGIWPWIIGLIALAALAWYFLGGAKPEMPREVGTVSIEAPALEVGGVDVGEEFNTAVSGIRTSLESVTDVASARDALPRLEEADATLGRLTDVMGSAPDAAQSAMARLVGTAMGTLRPLVDQVLAIEGVGDVLRPVLDPVLQKMETLEG